MSILVSSSLHWQLVDIGKEYKGVHVLKTPNQAPDVHVSEMPSDEEEIEAEDE